MPVKSCPGAANISGTPTLKVKTCPECGAAVELFSTDVQLPCPGCGFIVYNDIQSCINWCRYARECIGDEMYSLLVKVPDDPL
jgi:transposase